MDARATIADRSLSGHTAQRAAARKVFTTTPRQADVDREEFVEAVRALYATKVVAYAQGFDQIAAGTEEHGWDIDLGSMATIWRGGCIIRVDRDGTFHTAWGGDSSERQMT